MSSEAVALKSGIPTAARQMALRLAFGVTGCFALVEALDWDATFIAPMLAAQMLVKLPKAPSLKQGIGLIALFAFSTYGVLLVALAFLSNPIVLILVLGLILLHSFHAHFRGAPEIATLLVQISVLALPILAVISPDTALAFASTLVLAGIVAILTVFTAHAIFPAPESRSAEAVVAVSAKPEAAERQAILNTLVILLPLVWFVLDSAQTADMAIVMLITIVSILRQTSARMGQMAALGLGMGNLLGGVAAVLIYGLVSMNGTFGFFVAALLAASLIFAGLIVSSGERAPLFAIAFATFILLLGIGITPLPGGSGEAFASRLINVLLASAYAVGAVSLLGGRGKV
jgi:hypothetical protein